MSFFFERSRPLNACSLFEENVSYFDRVDQYSSNINLLVHASCKWVSDSGHSLSFSWKGQNQLEHAPDTRKKFPISTVF
jgi:hypothetical protein